MDILQWIIICTILINIAIWQRKILKKIEELPTYKLDTKGNVHVGVMNLNDGATANVKGHMIFDGVLDTRMAPSEKIDN